MEWVVTLDAEITGTDSNELADQIIGSLNEFSPAVGARGQRVGVTMSIKAATDGLALDQAKAAFAQALGPQAKLIDARAQTVDDLERELERS